MQKLSKEERRAIRDTDKSSSYLDDKNSFPPANLQVIVSLPSEIFLLSYSWLVIFDSLLFVVPIRWIVF